MEIDFPDTQSGGDFPYLAYGRRSGADKHQTSSAYLERKAAELSLTTAFAQSQERLEACSTSLSSSPGVSMAMDQNWHCSKLLIGGN